MTNEWFKIIRKINNDAAWLRQKESVEALLKQGVDVNCRNNQGQSALDIMIRKESPSFEFLQVLLAEGIELRAHRDLLDHIIERLDLIAFDIHDSPSANHAKTAEQHVYLTLWRALEHAGVRLEYRECKAFVEKFALGLDIQRNVERIKAQLKPFFRTSYKARECTVKAPWSSKFGGIPYLPDTVSLPACFDDDSLKFAFQINFEEIKDLCAPTPLPDYGLLQVFLYRLDPDECDCPEDRVEVLYWPELPLSVGRWKPFPELIMNSEETFYYGETGIEWVPFQGVPSFKEQPQAIDDAIYHVFPKAREDEELLEHWRELYFDYTHMPPCGLMGWFGDYELSEMMPECEGYLPILKKMQIEHTTCYFMMPEEAMAKADFSQLRFKRLWD